VIRRAGADETLEHADVMGIVHTAAGKSASGKAADRREIGGPAQLRGGCEQRGINRIVTIIIINHGIAHRRGG
jgi:hypothetical protein